MTAPGAPLPPEQSPDRGGAESTRFWNVPNVLTLLRIALFPVFAAMMMERRPKAAFLVFLVAGITDVLDGFAARLWHQKTKIGLLLDPAADKLMMTTAFILLAIPSPAAPNVLPLWLVLTAIGRDVAIVLAVYVLYRLRGITTFPPSTLGKVSTVCQVVMLWGVLLANALNQAPPYLIWVYYLTLALTLASGVDYGIKGWPKFSPKSEPAGKP
ncbi:MAG: CDP-alcohol phosphatidyltransferase family protein [Candidatus Aminicenantes bacterium]|nr:CDP-alcohol phosphatidyltransferase family protein [Candidatus Aminicenantes bacterium]